MAWDLEQLRNETLELFQDQEQAREDFERQELFALATGKGKKRGANAGVGAVQLHSHICPECGRHFTPHTASRPELRRCSNECRYAWLHRGQAERMKAWAAKRRAEQPPLRATPDILLLAGMLAHAKRQRAYARHNKWYDKRSKDPAFMQARAKKQRAYAKNTK